MHKSTDFKGWRFVRTGTNKWGTDGIQTDSVCFWYEFPVWNSLICLVKA